jgi:hypothetical protein
MSRSESAGANRRTERKGRSATPARATDRKRLPAAALRDTKRPIVVYVSEAERADIERRAEAKKCSLSDLLRSAALGAEIRGRAEAGAVLALCDANAELERLGALLGRLRPESAGEAADEEATDEAPLRELLARLPEARRRLAAAADALA